MCTLLIAFCVLFAIPAVASADPVADAPVTITLQADGSYLVAAPAYQAVIGSDGNLHSFLVNGVEFLDDHTGNAAGASYYAEHPVPLKTITVKGQDLQASDGIYAIHYRFDADHVSVGLHHTSPEGMTYVVIGSSRLAYVENLDAQGVAAAPADYNWTDVKVTMPSGEFLTLKGGARIWGREIGRQVWESGQLLANREYTLVLTPGRGTPPSPDLGQLTNLSVAMPQHDQIVPAGGTAELPVRFENNSQQAINTELAIRVESSAGVVLLDEKKPLICDAHQAVTLTWSVTPKTPDIYRVAISVNLTDAKKKYVTSFGYDIPSIAMQAVKPADYAEYWQRVVTEARTADVTLQLWEDQARSTGTVKVDEVGIVVDGVKRFSGWLSVPRYPGRYPVLLILPSDRMRTIGPNPTLAECGFVVMSIEPTGKSVRVALDPLITQAMTNLTNPNTVGLRNIMIRYMWAVSAVTSATAIEPKIDPNRLAVTGAGIGGGMSLLLASLDDRVQAVAPDVPYLCHIAAGSERADWPYLEVADYLSEHPEQRDGVMKTLSYYDVAHVAGAVNCPVLLSAGLNDTYAQPANVLAVYNQLPGPRALDLYIAGHEGGGVAHWAEKMRWLTKILGGPSPEPAVIAPTPAGVVGGAVAP